MRFVPVSEIIIFLNDAPFGHYISSQWSQLRKLGLRRAFRRLRSLLAILGTATLVHPWTSAA